MTLRISNGIYDKNIYITSSKFTTDIYFPLNNSFRIDVNEFDVDKVADLIRQHYNKANFIIDMRLEYIILVLDSIFPGYITIFNIYDTTFEPINKFISGSAMFSISEFYLYTPSKQKLVDMYLVIKYVSKNTIWKLSSAMNVLKQTTLVDLLLNYLGFADVEHVEILEKAEKFKDLVHNGFRNNDKNICIFDNKNELVNALIVLRNNDEELKVYSNA